MLLAAYGLVRTGADDTRPPDHAAVKLSPRRIVGFDSARLVAAAGVVWTHTLYVSNRGPWSDGWEDAGRFGTAFFAIAAVFFMVRGVRTNPGRAFAPYAVARFRRLYVPFLAWTAIYLLLRNARRLLSGAPTLVAPEPAHLLNGEGPQLWFLPFALLVCVGGFPLARAMLRRPPWASFVAGMLAGLGLAVLPEQDFEGYGGAGRFLERAWEVLPAVAFGFALAALDAGLAGRPDGAGEWAGRGSVAGIILFATATASVLLLEFTVLAKNLAGLGLFMAAMAAAPAQGKHLAWVGTVGRFGFGIYLIHPAFMWAGKWAAAACGVAPSQPTDVGVVVFAIAGSAGVASLLHRRAATRWLVT